MRLVQDLIARFNGGRVGGAHSEVEENEAAQAEAELRTATSEQVEAEADLEVNDVIVLLIVHDPTDETVAKQLVDAIQPRLSNRILIASKVDEARKQAVIAIKAVETLKQKQAEAASETTSEAASEAAEVMKRAEDVSEAAEATKRAEDVSIAAKAKKQAKFANIVVAVLVSAALEENEALVGVVASKLPNSLIPVLVSDSMRLQKSWRGVLSWYMANELYFDYSDPGKADLSSFVRQIRAKSLGEQLETFDVFMSHEWKAHEKVKEIAEKLEAKHKLKVWLDEKQMQGSINESMSRGIERSQVFLILATKRYMKKINDGDRSDNCLKEFQHADNRRFDRIVVAALEPDMMQFAAKWTGQFQFTLARQKPVDLTELSDTAIDCLANAIRMRIKTPEASSDITPRLRDLKGSLNPCTSEAWAKGKAKKFTLGTRSWIIDELCDWYHDNKSAVFILVGDGGVGKSVIMAELCRRGGALMMNEDAERSGADEGPELRRKSSWIRSLWRRSNKERQSILVAAYHFFRYDQISSAAPKEALVSIAWQLCLSVPGFADELESVSVVNARNKPLADVFQIILVNPLNKLSSDQKRQVVVLDALDESSKSEDFLRKVIRTWKDVMPAWLSLVVSTRPEGEIQRGISNNMLDSKVLRLRDEENFRDIKMHIEHLLRDMSDVVEAEDATSCAELLSKRSEGLFLWASFLPKTLERMHKQKRGGLLTYKDISKKDAIPNELGGMFHEYFDRLRDKMGGNEAYQSLLTPIVAAREPLSAAQLAELLSKSEKKTKKIIDDARNLLYQGGDGRVALIHKRMTDWLIDFDQSGDLCVDIEDGHETLAKFCSISRGNVFALRHAVFHSVKSGDRSGAFKLLNNFAWVKKAISVGVDNVQRRATIGNLIRDCVELGIFFAPESDTPRFLSKAVHALSYDPNELASQVLARLGHDSKNPLAHGLQAPNRPWLEPIRASLPHPRDPLIHVLKGHSYWVNSVAIEGGTIVSGFKDGTLRIWDATSGEEKHMFRGHSVSVTSVAIEGDSIVSGSYDGTVRIWDATSGEEQRILKGHSGPVRSVAIEGNTIVSGSWDKTVRIWDATSGEEQRVLEGHSDEVNSVAIEGQTIVSGSKDNTVRIWNAASGKEQHVLKEHSNKVNSVAIEGGTVVSGSDDNTIRICNATSGKERHVLKGHSEGVNSVAIDGDTLVSGSNDNTVRIWNATTGEYQHELKGHSDWINSVAIEGDTIVSGSVDNTVCTWNATLGEGQHVLKGHSRRVLCVAIGLHAIVSGAEDGTVRIWNAMSGEEQHVLRGHSARVLNVAIRGDTITSQSYEHTLYWSARTGEELDTDEVVALPPEVNIFVDDVDGTHIELSEGIGFTTDHSIIMTVRMGSVYAIGDASGMVHILHAQGLRT